MTEAKDDAMTPAAEVPADPTTGSAAVAGDPTDARRRFREALERKNATPGTHPGSQADGSNSMKSSNGKRQRQFRRKSGG